jgi:hypothetical protein
MPFTLTWGDIAVRLACTLIAGILVGVDRGERREHDGDPALIESLRQRSDVERLRWQMQM